ncbi:MAG: type ISP restriction/modification enzyme [Desulfobulbus sp.]|nr:type ISP restriction/modification enzyme [Desulfobulbus sp.]
MKEILSDYLSKIQALINSGKATEESYYHILKEMIDAWALKNNRKNCEVLILPKATEGGNPDFRVWDGKARITGYIEAKKPETFHLDPIAVTPQLKRYLETFPNLILTNFFEFRLYQHGELLQTALAASPINATQMKKTPPLLDVAELDSLLERYFEFDLPAITDPQSLADALAKRTRFLRDEILHIMKQEYREEEDTPQKGLPGFYDAFKKMLISKLTIEQFADLYAQTLTYGIFAARTRSDGEFHRELIYQNIPGTLGILKNIFRYISLEEPPKALAVQIEDIADILFKTDIKKILHRYYVEGRGSDPIVHFYETFLSVYDPELREKRGVYYTPEPVVRYIVRSIHSLLKSRFDKEDGLASPDVTILDPAAGTLTFPAEAIRLAISHQEQKYGEGSVHKLIEEHILPNFHAIELMMAPYTVGHLKISYLLGEYGYEMKDDERFKLYLSNTLEMDIPEQMFIPFGFGQQISEEGKMANRVKHEEPILVILGNPPYSGESENTNKWTEKLLKTDLDGAQSYYKVDGAPLGERNPKWLQDDYVKFLRFAQWKIHKAGRGIVGMITNHSYLDNPTFRGMRQSLMETFDEIYLLDLHGNSLKKEKAPDGGKDENVFDIRQGTAIVLMVKHGKEQPQKVAHRDLYGVRDFKYEWLENREFQEDDYEKTKPLSPFYLFIPQESGNEHYLKWTSLPEIFPLNSVGIVTARDRLTIQDTENELRKTIHHFASLEPETARTAFNLGKDARDWKVDLAQNDLKDSGLNDENIVPIFYRPFDIRYTYYTGKSRGFHCMPRNEVMRHMLEENIGIISVRQVAEGIFNHVTISDSIVESRVTLSNKGIGYIFPLYLYPDEEPEDIFESREREFNIEAELLERFHAKWLDFVPHQLFYYVYAILHSPKYRERFAQYLKIDFPRIPFTDDFGLFEKLAELGRELAELHLLKSARLSKPIAKYQGKGANDRVEFIRFDAQTQRVEINGDKWFEGISEELWNFHVGGYQVLHKYLKDRKGKSLADPIHYCRMATALKETIALQTQIDELVDPVLEAGVEE